MKALLGLGCVISLIVIAASIHDLVNRPFDPSDVGYLVMHVALISAYAYVAVRRRERHHP